MNDLFLLLENKKDISPEEIIQKADEILLKEKTNAFAYKAKAYALNQLNLKEEAISNLFFSLKYNKMDFMTFFLLGHFLAQEERFEDAIKVLKESILLHPAQEIAYAALANVLYCTYANQNEIIENIQNALLLNENQNDALNLMHQIFKNEKAFEDHLKKIKEYNLTSERQVQKLKWKFLNEESLIVKKEIMEKALNLMPDDANLNFKMAGALVAMGENNQGIPYLEKAIFLNQQERNSNKEKNKDLVYYEYGRLVHYPYTVISAQKMGEFAQEYAALRPLQPQFQFKKTANKKRLKIGFVSMDLRFHVVTKFFENFLKSLKNTSLDCYAYTKKDIFDEVSNDLEPYFRRWQTLHSLTDLESARLIHQDNIDILFDLSGMTVGGGLNIFRFKPAPIGVTWIGWLGGVGTPGVDYILVDSTIAKDSHHAKEFVEKPFVLPLTWLLFTPPVHPLPLNEAPVLKNKYITFGAFQNPNKVTEETVDLWANVLKKTQHTKLIYARGDLKDPLLKEYIFKRFEKYAIPNLKERLILKEGENYFLSHYDVDLILDTFPASSGTTAWEACFMGVPTVVQTAELMASKLSAVVLNNCGLQDFVAQSKEEYIFKAQHFVEQFTKHPQQLNALRLNLRQNLLQSPGCNAPLFAQNFEKAMWQMWNDFEQGIYPKI